jgi:hypothetical protein
MVTKKGSEKPKAPEEHQNTWETRVERPEEHKQSTKSYSAVTKKGSEKPKAPEEHNQDHTTDTSVSLGDEGGTTRGSKKHINNNKFYLINDLPRQICYPR